MSIRKSAKKTIRQDSVRRMRNRSDKTALKTQIKKFVSAIKSHDFDEAGKRLSLVTKKLDKIAAKNIIHKKTASRKKARLAKFLNKQKVAA
jgi:small subunit ribosomal protein S20